MDKSPNDHNCCHHSSQANKVSSHTEDSSNIIYIFPMHLTIRQKGPGNCPICGMA
ncbi:heavy metal-binding domain-containing protein [Legionella gresilensis]|uniref:heavy metal-binding domain-containing protein n=1 Tax=Legionella gresilensis TaxID=91823 RepID=UPI0013EF8F4C|nr:heavy metal-binding domain-containing protein [Legionella gresilensis]